MARPLRIEYEGAVYHVTSRGNAKSDIYLDDEDRELFLDVLKYVVEEEDHRVRPLLYSQLAFCGVELQPLINSKITGSSLYFIVF